MRNDLLTTRAVLLASVVVTVAQFQACHVLADETVNFERDVRPLLESHCYDCHGSEMKEAGLRLDRKAPALTGSDNGQVIIPGDAAGSPLIKRISSDDPSQIMPPDGEPLAKAEIATLEAWINAGAPWPDGIDGPPERSDHWAYQPIGRPEPPVLENHDGIVNPVDAFVIARLEDEDIELSPIADRYTLIKRLSYDLLGLPPDPAAVTAFAEDTSPDAYERLVDELLRSPHFGERWGRHWLDKARYADSDGYEKDNPRYNAWKYRDWVIEAVNSDMPFDQFTIEQLAGDLLPHPTDDQLLATSFNRQTLTNTEGGTDKEQWRVEAVFDRVETLGTVWLGLTVGCARCHSHKYDEISQREYYQLFAFFNNGDETTASIVTSEQAYEEYLPKKAAFDKKLAEVQQPWEQAREALRPEFPGWVERQEQRLAGTASEPATFHPVTVQNVSSEAGTSLAVLEDGSVLASGEAPATDVYTVQFPVDQPITGVKLEVLADESLPNNGPGRAANGNFVLSQIAASLAPAGPDAGEPQDVPFVAARADFTQKSLSVTDAIGELNTKKGWAIADEQGKDHEAVFAFAAPLNPERTPTLTIRLVQKYEKSPHTIGRFRITAMTGMDADLLALPDDVQKILAIDSAGRTEKQTARLFNHFTSLDPEVQKHQAAIDEFKKSAPFDPHMQVRIIEERTQDRRETHVLKRGDFLQPLGPVQADTLDVLHEFTPRSDEEPRDRLDLARWLVSEDNPLTPRVAVNHIWSHLFGTGLVKTVNDFGVRGEAPTHPQLLDWLASEFMRLGWSRKQLIKTILMSRTYRQSSVHRPELADRDPENRLLYRQNRFRVEAEIVRDLNLAVSGLLEPRIGGPSVFPPLPPDIAALSYANNFQWGESTWNKRPDKPHGVAPKDDDHRRGMYTFFKRTAAHPTLVAFDCPDANVACVNRQISNTPLQALATLNNDVFVEVSRAFVDRVLSEVNTNDAARIEHAFRLCVARPPATEEVNGLLALLVDARSYYAEHPEQSKTFAGETLPPETSATDAAAWVATARIILNLDEFITRE